MIEVLPLTPEEKRWLKKLQAVLNECPSNRMESYTIGDDNIVIYDISANDSEEANNLSSNNNDWCHVIDATETELAVIKFPFSVLSTAG